MTTLFQEELICTMCGAKSGHTDMFSTNSFGSPDLDLRPPEMQRSTMDCWVQECPSCGYAYSSIEEKADNSEVTISSDAYVEILSGNLNGTLTGRFVKASLIAEQAADIDAAANYALSAAWAADDASNGTSANSCRHRAASLFEELLKGMDHSSEEAISICAIMVDILRRSEQWEKAISLAETMLSQNLDPTIKSVLEFEISAASRHDAKCYTIDQALGEK